MLFFFKVFKFKRMWVFINNILYISLMSQLSAEVIINDFEKLKEIFDKLEEEFIWNIFSNSEFNFNKALEILLLDDKTKIDEKKNIKKKFNPMDTLSTLFKNKSSINLNSHNDYQRLD